MGFVRTFFGFLKFNRKNWKAIVLSMMAATVFWFLNALNKQYTTNISFPLNFEYDPKYYVPVDPPPGEIQMNVTGLGWDLLRRSLGFNVPPLVIPLERPTDVRKIVGATLPGLFSSQIEALQINFVLDDTIAVNFEPRVKKILSLTLDPDKLKLDPDYVLVGDIKIIPDSIFIDGPVSAIVNLPEPFPLEVNESNIRDDYDETMSVRLPNNHLVMKTPSEVIIRFDVERTIVLSDSIPLKLTNVPHSARLQLQNEKVFTSIRTYESSSDQFPWDSLQAVVDLGGLKKGKHSLLPVVSGLPGGSSTVALDSIHISY